MVFDITARLAGLAITDDIAEAIDEAIAELRKRYAGKKVPLQALEDKLAALHLTHGLSMRQFTQHIRARGICLGNCKVYGSTSALALFLRTHKNMIVPREKAKAYKHVKQCLIMLYTE